MENKILLKAGIKRHKGTLAGIFILTFLAAAALGTVITSQIEDLQDNIEALDEIERVEIQNLIYADYTANGLESDSEGQLITYIPTENRYRFFTDDLSGYTDPPESILPGEVYVPPSMVSMFGIGIGDEITYPIARAGRNLTLTIKGFYEDVMMGSSRMVRNERFPD